MKRKILYIVALSLMLIGLCKESIKFFVKKQLDLTKVYVASHKIEPRKKITEEDLFLIEVPKGYLADNVILEKEDIIGLYNLSNHYIFKNSFFYKESLEKTTEMIDYPLFLLDENQVLYELEIADIECPRFNVNVNQYADIYVTIKDSKSVISDLLISNVQIIAAYDAKGTSIKERDASNIYSIIIGIDEKLINTLNVAKNKGKISLYIKADTYKEKNESILNESSAVLNYLNLIE